MSIARDVEYTSELDAGYIESSLLAEYDCSIGGQRVNVGFYTQVNMGCTQAEQVGTYHGGSQLGSIGDLDNNNQKDRNQIDNECKIKEQVGFKPNVGGPDVQAGQARGTFPRRMSERPSPRRAFPRIS